MSIIPNQQPGDALIAAGITPVHPGIFFAGRTLASLKISPEIAAERLGLTPEIMLEFMKGAKAVDTALATSLSRLTGTTPVFWENMQTAYNRGTFGRNGTAVLPRADKQP